MYYRASNVVHILLLIFCQTLVLARSITICLHMQNIFCKFNNFQFTFRLLETFIVIYTDYVLNVTKLEFIIELIRDPLS